MYEPGKLITFEGVDVSGKSLQAKLLAKRLTDDGFTVTLLREPGSTAISEQIRNILLDTKNRELVKEAELLLYSAARTQMVTQQIIPNLEQGNIVLCDRYYDSTTAYQGYARRIDLEFIVILNTFVSHGIRPDLTFLIDIDPEIAIGRKNKKEAAFDRLENEAMEFHQAVREGYLEIANSDTEKKRFVIIDGNRDIETIHAEIYKLATRL